MSYYPQSTPYGGAQSIDGVMVLDGAMRPPPHVSRTATAGRRTSPAQFHRPNTDPMLNPFRSWGYYYEMPVMVMPPPPPPPPPGVVFALATPAAPSQSRYYPEADYQRQRRPHGSSSVREQLMTEFNPAEETAVLMPPPLPPPPPPAWRQRRRHRYVREEFAEEFHNQTEAAAAASADEYEFRTTGASESAIGKLKRVEIIHGGGGWKQDDCAICLEEMDSGEGKVVKLECRHVFHESCLVSWLRKSNCCPLCRFRIAD
ncbi:E3 ubiquitin-protein ligase RING1-like [Linum grandiflorum]